MKSLITTLLTIGILAPVGTAYAFVDVDALIEKAKQGQGTYVESNSSVSTGGQTARSGETVTTGDVSASSHTETVIKADGSGSSVHVETSTTENGVTKKQTLSKDFAPEETVHVNANASSENGQATSEIKVNDTVIEADTAVETQSTIETTGAASASQSQGTLLRKISKLPSKIRKFLSALFSW